MNENKNMLIVLRHGQTEWNKTSRLMSRTDLPLSPEGRDQCFSAATDSRDVPVDRIICSPLRRAAETAEIFADTLKSKPPITTDSDLVELDFGIFEGFSGADLAKSDRSKLYAQWKNGVDVSGQAQSEPWHEAAIRADRVFSRHALIEDTTLIVGHGYMLRLFVAHCIMKASPENLRRLRLDNCRFGTVEKEGDLHRVSGIHLNCLVGIQEHAATS